MSDVGTPTPDLEARLNAAADAVAHERGWDDWAQMSSAFRGSLKVELDAALAAAGVPALIAKIEQLKQAAWDAYGILGFDQDGDKTPAGLTHPPFPEFIRQFAREARQDYDEAADEAERLRAQRQAALNLCDEADAERRKVDYDDWESGYLKGREYLGIGIRAALGADE